MVQLDCLGFLTSGVMPIINSSLRRSPIKIHHSFSRYKFSVRDAQRTAFKKKPFPFADNLKATATAQTSSTGEFVTSPVATPTVLTFQEAIQRLSAYWASKGCIIWHPYNVEVGAGTMNPATFLRVLGPEPWSVAYDEPSIRPDDSRYGDNPNRLQRHTQFQVILKPAPDCAQELVVGSYQALGIDTCSNDVRFVEDNWESPALGAWGLGWEVWLNGMEVTQFTYFQQAGGITLDSVSVEITYGLERIIMALQGKAHFKDIIFSHGITYGDIFLQNEIEMSRYNLNEANIDQNKELFNIYEAEALTLIEKHLPVPAYNYVLKASHTFNILDARGAIGVTERARYFQKMRTLSRDVAHLWLTRREELNFPMLSESTNLLEVPTLQPVDRGEISAQVKVADFVLEIGVEELPAGDISNILDQVRALLTVVLDDARLDYSSLDINGTPRRILAFVHNLQTRQADEMIRVRGPPTRIGLKDGEMTKAGLGFMRSQGVSAGEIEIDEGEGYMYATIEQKGRSAESVLADELPSRVLERISFGKSMRWNHSGVSFSRPVRWLLCLLDDRIISFSFAGISSSNKTRSMRGSGGFAIDVLVASASQSLVVLQQLQIMLSRDQRAHYIRKEATRLAQEVGGVVSDNYLYGALLDEIVDLVENPIPLSGKFDSKYLELPTEVLETVMKKHQRYLPVARKSGRLVNKFITVANGNTKDVNIGLIRQGNEAVLRARYADAAFFYEKDTKGKKLSDFVPQLSGLIFQEKLGSMLDKTKRVGLSSDALSKLFGLSTREMRDAKQVANLYKADLATSMVIEMTSLAGTMGRHYAKKSGEVSKAVSEAIFEANLPRFSGDKLAKSKAGAMVAIADRMDSLVGLFSVGLIPKSTADPFALRRAALGVVQTLVAAEFDVNLSDLIRISSNSIKDQVGHSIDSRVQKSVITFISKRLEGYLLDNEGFDDDVVKSALQVERNRNSPLAAISVCRALREKINSDKGMVSLAQEAHSRAVRLLASLKDVTTDDLRVTEIHKELFECKEEQLLFASLQEVNREKHTGLSTKEEVETKIQNLVDIKNDIDAFFDGVFVNVDDAKIRKNRLALCARIVGITSNLVDLTCLVLN